MSNCFEFIKKQGHKNTKNQELKESLVEVVNENEGELDEIKQIVKYIEDETKTDQSVIEYIEDQHHKKLNLNKRILEFRYGTDEQSFLHLAAKNCRNKVCTFLIDIIQIDKDIKSRSNQTAFHVFISTNVISKQATFSKTASTKVSLNNLQAEEKKFKFKETFNDLISRGIDYNCKDNFGNTPVHYAALKNNYEAIVNLISLKTIDISAEDKTNMTALAIACKLGFDDIALLLIEKSRIENFIDLNSRGLPLHLACKQREEKFDVIKSILDKIKNDRKDNSIIISRFYNDTKKDDDFNWYLNEILNKTDYNNQTLISILVHNNHLKIIELLLKEYNRYIVDIEDPNGNLIIHLAAKNGSPDLLKLLIKYNAFSVKSNKNYENALHIAAANNKFNFIKEYLAYEKIYAEKYLSDESEVQAVNANEVNNNDLCTLTAYIPSVKCFDKETKTPLFIAVINGHLKCVEVLTASEDVDLEAKDPDGNSVYHICAELNNFESIRYLITRKEPKFQNALYIKNHNDNNVIHTACQYGNLEVIRLVLTKINEGFSSTEAYLSTKNKDGYTCFHIACIKGYYNIIEYFLKDLKMKFFLDILDKDSNNSLHLASINGNLAIVSLLTEYGIDISLKNKDGNTALELAFQKGYFEIIKLLVSTNSNIKIQEGTKNEYPLHVAAYEGSYEIVSLLLSKGIQIDTLNNENKNCLDVAIERDQREVIKVLLKDPNWSSLVDIRKEEKLFKNPELSIISQPFVKNKVEHENPQLCEMFDKKMWDLITIILDNCVKEETYDFTKLDPPTKDIQKHPLMLLAKSGQETLLKHPTVQKLLALKWRFLPRLTFYSNLLFYFLFMTLFSIYSVKLSNHINDEQDAKPKIVLRAVKGAAAAKDKNADRNGSIRFDDFEDRDLEDVNIQALLSIILLITIGLSLLKNLLQIILIDRFSYFNSFENLFEVVTYILAAVSIISTNFMTKLTCSSVGILSSFIVFTFLIQKLRGFGLYVLAFRRTLHNSAKFFPIFLLVFIGFSLSFRLQTHFAVSNKSVTEGGLVIKTLIMVLGGLETEEMGLDENAMVNFIIYFLFISIICVILVNLFVGIAVGEITTVLDEADVQQISMRIIFVLKVQESLKPFIKGEFSKKYLDLQFEGYSYDNEYKFIKTQNKILEFLKKKFSSVEPSVELIDPQQRLEESLIELTRSTNTDIKTIRENLSHQIGEVEHKLANSQQRIEDCLVEMTCRTTTNFESTKEDSSNSIGLVEVKLDGFSAYVTQSFYDIVCLIRFCYTSLKQSVKNLIKNLDLKLTTHLVRIENKLDLIINMNKSNQIANNDEFATVKNNLIQVSDHLIDLSRRLEKIIENIAVLENYHSTQIEKGIKLETLLDDTREKIEQQKTILLDIPKHQSHPIEEHKAEKFLQPKLAERRKSELKVEPDKVKALIKGFDQPTLSTLSKFRDPQGAKLSATTSKENLTEATSRKSSLKPDQKPTTSKQDEDSSKH